jgi:hypothetical protein
MAFFTPFAVTWAAKPPAASLPEAIITTLNQEYTGWKYAAHAPAVVAADFNGDGKRDYAVQIALPQEGQEEQIVIVFMKSNDGYEEAVLQSQGLDPALYLSTTKKKVTDEQADGSSAKSAEKDVLQVLGSALGDTLYAQENGEFHELKQDDANPPKTDDDVSQ